MKATLIKTAVEWLESEMLENYSPFDNKLLYEAIHKAKEMEKEQIVKHSVELTKILISNSFKTSGKTPKELVYNYFNKTFKQ